MIPLATTQTTITAHGGAASTTQPGTMRTMTRTSKRNIIIVIAAVENKRKREGRRFEIEHD